MQILLCGDSYYCIFEVLIWCCVNGIGYCFGVVLIKILCCYVVDLEVSIQVCFDVNLIGGKIWWFKIFYYVVVSWGWVECIIVCVEVGLQGCDIWFIVISLIGCGCYLYEKVYCVCGQVENYIKFWKIYLVVDCMFCYVVMVNQFCLFLYIVVYWLMWCL